MGLISEHAVVRLSGKNYKHYKELGYDVGGNGNKNFTLNKVIRVKVEDLTHGSHALVEIECDCCKKQSFCAENHSPVSESSEGTRIHALKTNAAQRHIGRCQCKRSHPGIFPCGFLFKDEHCSERGKRNGILAGTAF